MGRKYSADSSKEVAKTMHEYKHEGKFKSRSQAVAVGLHKARAKGERVPKKGDE